MIADEEHMQEFVLPDNVESLPGVDLGAMVSSGELAAGIGVTHPDTRNVKPLIDDIPAKEREWADEGIYPISHTIVIKNEIIDNYRGLAAGLYKALVEAKRLFSARLAAGGELSDEDKSRTLWCRGWGGSGRDSGSGASSRWCSRIEETLR